MFRLRTFLVFVSVVLLAATSWMTAAPTGVLQGHLDIISSQGVELADGTPSKATAENYVDYPLAILSRDKQTEVAHVTADEKGNYRIALPAGDYILDLRKPRRGHVRTTPQSFTIVADQTVHLDMTIDAGVR
jgi:hypothetical protein